MWYPELKAIIREFEQNGDINTKLDFKCYEDNIATYHLNISDGSFHEICVINEIGFFPKMTIKELLYKNPFFVSHRFFMKLDKIAKQEYECEDLITFRLVDYKNDLRIKQTDIRSN